jgi:hypothetical protein
MNRFRISISYSAWALKYHSRRLTEAAAAVPNCVGFFQSRPAFEEAADNFEPVLKL